MADSTPNRSGADANLLFGILALQLDFLGRDALIAGMNAWVLEKALPLAEILVRQGVLRPDARELLDGLVGKHLALHDNDPEKSLGALSSIGSLREELSRIPDTRLQASLSRVSVQRCQEDDNHATRAPSIASAPSLASRFRILRPHAKGGLGQVSVAEDAELHREVALKEIQDQHADDPDSRLRFLREAEITGGLEHPGIVPVYSLGTYADGRPFYAMRFIHGDSLHEAIARFHKRVWSSPGDRMLELRKLLARFLDVCNAIEYAHSRGVLHRDLKPGNVMLGQYGETLVVDWGLARPLGVGGGSDPSGSAPPLRPPSAEQATPTRIGEAVGTPQFMSPEQAEGALDRLGPASDVYSLGATLYFLLTGQAPFDGPGLTELLHQVQRGEFRSPRQVVRDVPAALEAICLKAMSLKSEDRYPSARLLADDVEHWLADEPVTAQPESLSQRLARWTRRHRAWVRALATALVLVTMVAVVAALKIYEAQGDEKIARNRAEEALEASEKNRTRAERLLARMAIPSAVERMNAGDLLGALPWMAQAQRWDRGEGENEPAQQIRVGSLLSLCPRILHLWIHEGPVLHAALSPDGKQAVTSSTDGTARVWNMETGKILYPPLKHDRAVNMAVFSGDGKFLVTACADGTAQVWDGSNGRPRSPKLSHDGAVVHVVFSADGRLVASASADARARVWEVSTGKLVCRVAFKTPLLRTAFSPTGRIVAGLAPDGQITAWSVPEGQVGWTVKHENAARLAFSADGKFVLSAEENWQPLPASSSRTWHALTGEPTAQGTNADLQLYGGMFRPDGRGYLRTAGNSVELLNAETGKPAGPLLWHAGRIRQALFTPSGSSILTAGDDHCARVWDLAHGPTALDLNTQPTSPPIHAVLSEDGSKVLTAHANGTLCVLNTATGERAGPLISPLLPPERKPLMGPFDQSRVLVAQGGGVSGPGGAGGFAGLQGGAPIGGGNGQLGRLGSEAMFLEVARRVSAAGPMGRNQPSLIDHLRTATLSPDGKRVLLPGNTLGDVMAWETATGRPLPLVVKNWSKAPSVLSSDYSRAVIREDNESLTLRDLETGKTLWNVSPKGHVVEAAFLNGGKILYAVSDHNPELGGLGQYRMHLWDADTGKAISRPFWQGPGLTQAMVSPRRKTMVSVARGQVRIWDLQTGELVREFVGHTDFPELGGPTPRFLAAEDRTGIGLGLAGETRIVNVETGEIQTSIRHEGDFAKASFSPDNRVILVVAFQLGLRGNAGRASVWDLGTSEALTPSLPLPDYLSDVRFSPAGESVIFLFHGPNGSHLWTWKVRDRANAAKLLSQAVLLSGREVDENGRLTFATPARIAASWPEGGRVLPEMATSRSERIRNWHTREVALLATPLPDLLLWHAEKQLESGAESALVLCRRAEINAQFSRWDAVLADAGAALALDPNSRDARLLQSRAFLQQRQTERALDIARSLLAGDAEDWEARSLLGQALSQKGAWDQAIVEFSRILTRQPTLPEVRRYRAIVHAELERWEDARADFVFAPSEVTVDGWSIVPPALLAWQTKGLKGYRTHLSALASSSVWQNAKGGPEALVHLSCLVPEAFSDLRPFLTKAKELSAAQPGPQFAAWVGYLQFRTGDDQAAIEQLSKAGEDDPLSWLFLAMAHHRLGKKTEAENWLAKAAAQIDKPGSPRLPWERRLVLRNSYAEAQTLIAGKKP